MALRAARDGAIIFGGLIGKLDLLRVACYKCGLVLVPYAPNRIIVEGLSRAIRERRGRRAPPCKEG